MKNTSIPIRTNGKRSIATAHLLVLGAVLALWPVQMFGLGVRIPMQDPEAVARGNAFVATADNPSALYYNPAGITQLQGKNFQIGILNYLGIDSTYDSFAGKHSETKSEVVSVPQIYYTYTPKDSLLSYGLGVYAPFGLGLQWPENSGFRSQALTAKLEYVTLNPVVAWHALPSLSLAAGPTINYSRLRLRRGLASATDMFKFDGQDVDLGFNAGALWQPHKQWSFGANYRSATTQNYQGTARYNPGITIPPTHASGSFNFPQIVSGGVSFRPTEKWNIEVNVDWTDWNKLNTVTLNGTHNLGFPGDLPLALNWRGSWFYELGVTRYLNEKWSVSAGYFFSTQSTSERDFNPIVPDTDLHVGSLGLSYKGEKWRCAIAGQIITSSVREVKSSLSNPFTGQSANGRYQLFVPTVSVSVGYRF